MSQFPNRAALWLNKLAPDAPLMSGLCPSVQVADGQIDGESVRFIAVVPDANNHYPRAAGGEVGLLEGWKAGRWRKWSTKPSPLTPTSLVNGRSSP